MGQQNQILYIPFVNIVRILLISGCCFLLISPAFAQINDPSTDIAIPVFHLDGKDINADLNLNNQPSDGTSISTWGDRSDNAAGSGTDLSFSASGSARPTFQEEIFGDRGGLQFDGGSDLLNRASDNLINLTSYSEKSFALVFRTGSSINGLQIIYEQGGGVRGYQFSIKNGILYAFVWNNNEWSSGNQYKSINLGTVSANTSYILTASHDATAGSLSGRTWEANVNNGPIQTLSSVDVQQAHSNAPGIGGTNGNTRDPATFNTVSNTSHFNGQIVELISWNTALTATNFSDLYTYLDNRWRAPRITIETQPDGSGTEVSPQNITAGNSLTVYSIARDAQGNFIENTAADSWSLENISGGVVAGDLVVAGDSKSATFNAAQTGSAQIKAMKSSFVSENSGTLTVVPGSPAKLTLQTQPSNSATAGQAFAQQPVIRVEDSFDNLVTSDNSTQITASRQAGTGTLQGTTTQTASSGTVTFTNLSHNIANNITLNFSASGLNTIESDFIAVSPASASQLVFKVQPSQTGTNRSISPPVEVRLQDPFNNNVSQAGATVNISLSSGTGTLSGTTSVPTNSAGIAVFDNLTINQTGSKTLQATSTGLTSATSNTFNIDTPPNQNVVPANAQFSADDANTIYSTLTGPVIEETAAGDLAANETIVFRAPSGYEWDTGGTDPTVTITADNDFGFTQLDISFVSRTSTEITFQVDQESGEIFGIPLTGIATFGNLRIRPTTGVLPNTKNITNVGTTGPSGTTNYGTLTMVAGNRAQLVFDRQPSDATKDQPIAPSVRVRLQDQFGNNVSDQSVSISISLASGTGTLGGSVTKLTNSSGVAEFTDLNIDQTGFKTIQAAGTGLSSATSNSFEILNAGILTTFLVEAAGGSPISQQTAGQTFDIRITAVDGANSTISSFNGTVNISSNGTLSQGGGTTANFANGVLTSHTVSFPNTGSFEISATETGGSVTGESNSFSVVPGAADPATSLILADPSTIQNDGTSTSAITVQLRDANNNNLTSGGDNISLSTTAGSLGSVTDNSDGTYAATLTSSTAEETATITGMVNSQSINDDANVLFSSVNTWLSDDTFGGIFANDWDRAANWSQNAVPGPGEAVLIPTNPANGSGFPITSGINPEIKSLTIETNASITVSDEDTLTVLNTISGQGTVNAGNGAYFKVGQDITLSPFTIPQATVLFNGNSPQEIAGNLESDTLIVQNNASGVTASGDVTVGSILNIPGSEQLSMGDNTTLTASGDITGTGTLSGANSTLRFGGDITTLSSIDASSSDVIFEGSSAQLFNASLTTMKTLAIDNIAGVTANNNVTVNDQLSLTNGTLTMGSGFSLIANNKNISNGNLRFLRELTGSTGWRLLSGPVNSTHDDFLDAIVTQGYPGAFYDSTVSPNDTLQPNVFWYEESYPGTDNQRFRTLSSAGDPIVPGRGLFVFVFGNIAGDSRYNNTLPDTLSITGQEFEGTGGKIDFNVTYTTEADSGFNLVGNPFGAAINWDHSSWTKTNIGNTIYVWDPSGNSGNGEYLYWNGTTGTLSNGIIPPFQAFWIKANGSNPVLRVDKAAKTTGGTFFKKTPLSNKNSVPTLEFLLEANDLRARTHLTFTEQAKRGWDRNDGYWLTPLSDTYMELFSVLEGGRRMSINNLPRKFGTPIEIPLQVNGFTNGTGYAGSATLSWTTPGQIPEEWSFILRDKKTGTEIDLRSNAFTQIQIASQGKAPNATHTGSPKIKGKAQNNGKNARFVLRINPGGDAAGLPSKVELKDNYPNPFNPTTNIRFALPLQNEVTIEIYDILGRKVMTLLDNQSFQAGTHTIEWDASSLASGVYIYRLITPNRILSKKMTLIK